MIRVDYHMHSHYSHDGVGSTEEHVRRAEEVGLAEICFTEHLDFYPSEDGLSCQTIPSDREIRRYLEEIEEVRQRTRIAVRAGLELDYKPEADRWVRGLLQGVSDREGALRYFQERGPEQGCLDYLEVVRRAVGTGLFDSLAHLDLMKRFRPQNGELMRNGELRERIVAILELMAATGTGIEINSAGLIHDPREAYPSLELLRLARERGVEVLTVGSDSHRPETVGRKLDAALSLAREAGYTHVYTFEQRIPTALAL